MCLIKRFSCCAEGSENDVFPDSHVLRSILTKPLLSRPEARWQDLLAFFGISQISLVKRRARFFTSALSRAFQILRASHTRNLTAETFIFDLCDDLEDGDDSDSCLNPVHKALDGALSDERTQHVKTECLFSLFFKQKGLLHYDSKLCVPCSKVRAVLGHDGKIFGHITIGNTLARLSSSHWRPKTRGIDSIRGVYLFCQPSKDWRAYALETSQPLERLERQRGSFSMYFIAQLLKAFSTYDCTKTYVDRLTK